MKNTISLKKNKEFKAVFSKGRWFSGRYVVLYILSNNLDINRIGIAVSKKTGKSVVRNHIKRIIRESYRLNECHIKKGFDIIILWKNKGYEFTFSGVNNDIKFLVKKSGLMEG